MTTDWGFHYGFGLFLGRLGPHQEIYHDGGIQGFASALKRWPADGVTTVILSNFEGAQADWLATQLTMLCLGEPSPAEVALSPSELDRYAGTYANAQLTVRVAREADHLLATAPGQIPVRLYPEGHAAFFAKSRPWNVVFEAAALVVHGQGPDVRLERTTGPAPRP